MFRSAAHLYAGGMEFVDMDHRHASWASGPIESTSNRRSRPCPDATARPS